MCSVGETGKNLDKRTFPKPQDRAYTASPQICRISGWGLQGHQNVTTRCRSAALGTAPPEEGPAVGEPRASRAPPGGGIRRGGAAARVAAWALSGGFLPRWGRSRIPPRARCPSIRRPARGARCDSSALLSVQFHSAIAGGRGRGGGAAG